MLTNVQEPFSQPEEPEEPEEPEKPAAQESKESEEWATHRAQSFFAVMKSLFLRVIGSGCQMEIDQKVLVRRYALGDH